MLRAHELYDFVDESNPTPLKTIWILSPLNTTQTPLSSTMVITNPQFEDCQVKEEALMSLINATISCEALVYVVGCKSSRQVWKTLEKHYSSNMRINIVNLKSDL